MLRMRYVVTVAVAAWALVAGGALLWAQGQVSQQEEEQKLIEVLKSKAADFDKAKACQRLAVIGTKEAVPVLAGMLSDEKLAHYARYALEPIPDPSVDYALRAAMGKLKGKLLVGVINSMGQRKDPKAVASLARWWLGDSDAEVAAAASAALGRIATPEAVNTLKGALSGAPALRPRVADACLACAEALLAQGNRQGAVAVYDAVCRADVPKHLRLAATRGAILARQSDGLFLLVAQLQADDRAMFGVALRAARELPGAEVTRSLLAELDKLPPERQALLIEALGDRRDAAALPAVPAVVKAAQGGPERVRLAAIRLLGRFGDASAVPVLLDAAVQPDAQLAQAARDSLAGLRGKEVDAALAALLAKSEGKTRAVVIELAGQRRIVSAVPALIQAADDPDQEVRMAALRALGLTLELDQLQVLLSRLASPKTADEGAAALQALKVLCMRTPDRDACAEKLLAAMAQTPVATKCALLECLGATGGGKALKAVAASARDPDEQLQDAATRVLGEWMSPDAAPVLRDLVKNPASPKFQTRALRGYIRIARQLDLPRAERLAMCREAMGLAQRDEEKVLVLQVLGRNASPESLAMAVEYLDTPGLKDEAAKAAVTIAGKIAQTHPAAASEAIKKVYDATGITPPVKPGKATKRPGGKKAKTSKAK